MAKKLTNKQREVLKQLLRCAEDSRFTNTTFCLVRPIRTLEALRKLGLAKFWSAVFEDAYVLTPLGRKEAERE